MQLSCSCPVPFSFFWQIILCSLLIFTWFEWSIRRWRMERIMHFTICAQYGHALAQKWSPPRGIIKCSILEYIFFCISELYILLSSDKMYVHEFRKKLHKEINFTLFSLKACHLGVSVLKMYNLVFPTCNLTKKFLRWRCLRKTKHGRRRVPSHCNKSLEWIWWSKVYDYVNFLRNIFANWNIHITFILNL